MPEMVNIQEFASAIGKSVDVATANIDLIEQARGLVAEIIGEQNPWPMVAKVTALAAAKRAFVNPDDVRQEAVGGTNTTYNTPLYETYVYLSENETERLRQWVADHVGSQGKPRYHFPGAWPYPDRAEREPDSVSG